MNRREMLKTVVGGAVAAAVGGPVIANQLAVGEAITKIVPFEADSLIFTDSCGLWLVSCEKNGLIRRVAPSECVAHLAEKYDLPELLEIVR